ncbi:MAG: non-canonical purine NTP pyrophosphatase, partial [Butyrivibrio sp.]|nr:non-canonical purine NTP pyrophosphatase [Butyrivibrio sp.]
MRIVFATGNNDKLKEIREILDTLNIEIISMKEAGVFEDVEEN